MLRNGDVLMIIYTSYHEYEPGVSLSASRLRFGAEDKMLPVLSFTRQHIDISIQFYKRLFRHRQIFSSDRVRRVSIAYDPYHERCWRELIAYLDRLDGFAKGQSAGGQ